MAATPSLAPLKAAVVSFDSYCLPTPSDVEIDGEETQTTDENANENNYGQS
jgi:hypothetical protein